MTTAGNAGPESSSAGTETPPAAPPDSALVCLALLAKLFEKPADYEALRHRHGDPASVVGEIDLIRYAREVGFKASAVDSCFERS
jgi:subfamily B ATP-binding cassette protein HlyB/CyaB